MRTIPWRLVATGLLLGATALLMAPSADAETRRVARRVNADRVIYDDDAPAEAATAYDSDVVVSGDCCEPAACCPQPCISYCDRSCSFKCSPRKESCIEVCDPCTGCKISVPVCLPECTEGCPDVCGRRALFGASVVTYRWCNGFEAVVRITRCGDIKVTYRG
jgi:hypothetical protein